jgi:protease-4
MDRPVTHSPIRRLALWAFWGLLPLALGIALAVLLVPVPKVAVIRFEGIIWSGSVPYLGEMLDQALDDRSMRAVVLAIDSPGGDVAATEELYYRLLDLREHKPLVVTIDYMAASGGYYMAAAGEYVYAKPTSLVGNVGVISFLPSVDERRYVDEDYVSTGPFKFSGGSRGDYVRQIDLSKEGFLEAIFAQREDRLGIDRQALSSGELFMGLQALRLGLVDGLGASSEAIQKAADLARVRRYRVADLNEAVYGDDESVIVWGSNRTVTGQLSRRDPAWRQRLYYLYLEPERRWP